MFGTQMREHSVVDQLDMHAVNADVGKVIQEIDEEHKERETGLGREIKKLTDRIMRYHFACAAYERGVRKFQRKIAARDSEISNLKDQIAEKDSEISRLNGRLARYRSPVW